MSKLSSFDYKKLEFYFKDYKNMEKDLRLIEFETQDFNHYSDENIGGGRSTRIYKPTEEQTIQLMEKLADNEEYQNKKKILNAIDAMYERGEPETRDFIERRYWGKGYDCTFEYIAEKMYRSKTSTIRFRNGLLEKFADMINWF